jgi:hypothetical protein
LGRVARREGRHGIGLQAPQDFAATGAAQPFESWEFRWADVVRYAHDHSLEPSARDEMLEASLASSRQEHRFFVTLSGMDFKESNLAAKTPAWRVLLIDPGPPKAVEEVLTAPIPARYHCVVA